jgi:hypothetical protein
MSQGIESRSSRRVGEGGDDAGILDESKHLPRAFEVRHGLG